MSELYFLDEATIRDAYNVLTSFEESNGKDIFYLLILKYAGISPTNYIDLADTEVKENLLAGAKKLSYLFIADEHETEKSNFINPLSMDDWGTNTVNPRESIRQWATSRLKNNVTGGGTYWKMILDTDPQNPTVVKLSQTYLEQINVSTRISLDGLSLWASKYQSFTKKETALSEIMNSFKNHFRISDDENSKIFTISQISVSYSTEITSPSFVRGLIGNPKNEEDWLSKTEMVENTVTDYAEHSIPFEGGFTSMSTSINCFDVENVLEKANQVILMGPPGTSKSFITSQLMKLPHYVHSARIQFHPQYSYQDFIGGAILENGSMRDQKGVFVEFVEKSMNDLNNKYLFIIEEINRANVSQVFGELIQLLDRGESLTLTFNGETKKYFLPENLKILGTMNTTDRTVGRIDYAIKRRFYMMYCDVDTALLVDKVEIEDNLFSVAELLNVINSKLVSTLNNNEMKIGHASFMKPFAYCENKNKFVWEKEDFENLFYYAIIPIIEDYCNRNTELVLGVLGEELYEKRSGDAFIEAVQRFLSQ